MSDGDVAGLLCALPLGGGVLLALVCALVDRAHKRRKGRGDG